MWTTLSAARWVFLLSLAAVMILSTSGDSFNPIDPTCCFKVSNSSIKVHKIKECYELTRQRGCRIHAYLVKNKAGKKACINPEARWIVDVINRGKLICN
ncbi:C-C motif chemokine 26-like isoform X2 [Notolabrus celidotus]|uniref:C-C motif chemokine 26-like isoform X2 n=1 Tax=Notolabrus celidotus TaxID=1203425 RepID=UPI0014905645|nr:C-C motif chemokine 26-like isoform X2 [Notolabrus celidotus]